jgi:hypothetical protein
MALLPYTNEAAPQQQAGLLNSSDPEMKQLFSMMLIKSLMGRRKSGGNNNILPLMMQMQQQERQAQRQMQSDALDQEKMNMARQQFGMQQQVLQQKLAQDQQEQTRNQELQNYIRGKGNQPEATTMPNQVAPQVEQASSIQTQSYQPQLFADLMPDPAQANAQEAQRREFAVQAAGAGKYKDAYDLMQKPENKLDQEMIAADVDSIKKGREASTAAQTMLPSIKNFRETVNGISDNYVGPVIGRMGPLNQVLEPKTQELNRLGNELALKAKSVLGMTGAMSDNDIKFLKELTLNTSYDKEQLLNSSHQLEELANKAISGAKFKELYLKKHGNLVGADSEFLRRVSELDNQAQEAIQQGKDPKAVKEMLVKMRGY